MTKRDENQFWLIFLLFFFHRRTVFVQSKESKIILLFLRKFFLYLFIFWLAQDLVSCWAHIGNTNCCLWMEWANPAQASATERVQDRDKCWPCRPHKTSTNALFKPPATGLLTKDLRLQLGQALWLMAERSSLDSATGNTIQTLAFSGEQREIMADLTDLEIHRLCGQTILISVH